MNEIMQNQNELMYQTSYQASFSKENCFKTTLKNLKNISESTKHQPILVSRTYSTYNLQQEKPEYIYQDKKNQEKIIQDKIIELEQSHSKSIAQQRKRQSLENQKFLLAQIQEKKAATEQLRLKRQNYSASLQISEANNSKIKQQYAQELKQQIEEREHQKQQTQYYQMSNNKQEKDNLRLATEQEKRKSRMSSAKKQRQVQLSMEKDFQNKKILQSREDIFKKLWARQTKYQQEQCAKQEAIVSNEKKIQQKQFANFLRQQMKLAQSSKKEEHKKMYATHNSANFFERKLDMTPQKQNCSQYLLSSTKKQSSQKKQISRFL